VTTFIRTGTNKHSVGFSIPDDPNACWEWQGSCDPNGYGQAFNPRLQRVDKAHRVVWEWLHDQPLPPQSSGLELDHACRNRKCVIHTELVTVASNRSRRAPRPTPPITHGTIAGYNNRKCRCTPCTNAWSAYLRERRYQSMCALALAATVRHDRVSGETPKT
jgi:hypothetical protein